MAPKAKPAAKAASPTPGDQADAGAQEDAANEDYDLPVIIKVRPDDQLQLTPEELEKEVPPRVLYPANPRAAQNITYFSFKDRQFKRDDQVDQCVFHFQMDGAILLKDSQEAQDQMEIQDKKEEEQDKAKKSEAVDEEFDPPEGKDEEPEKNPLRNQFNFSERAAQTKNSVLRERGWTTEPPACTPFAATVTQWEIYDQYQKDIEAAKNAEKDEKNKGSKNESVNLLMGANGNVLRNECSGQVIMKTQLSGMPECKFALNDKLNMEKEGQTGKQSAEDKRRAVEIDDCTFHRCVRLGKFDSDRTITFVPPDGEFELMRYRVTGNISLPFRLVPAVQESGKTKLSVTLKATACFSSTKVASNVVIKFPVPPNTAKTHIKVGSGRAKFEPDQKAIVWRIKRWVGGSEFLLQADVDLMQTTKNKGWSRPPISVDFNVSMFTASGVYVRYLRVYDKSGYHTHRWVRYVTRAGEYQVRI